MGNGNGIVSDIKDSSRSMKTIILVLLLTNGVSIPTAATKVFGSNSDDTEVKESFDRHVSETRSLFNAQISIMDTLIMRLDSLIEGNRRSFTLDMQRACEDYREGQWFESLGEDGITFCNNTGNRVRSYIIRGTYGR